MRQQRCKGCRCCMFAGVVQRVRRVCQPCLVAFDRVPYASRGLHSMRIKDTQGLYKAVMMPQLQAMEAAMPQRLWRAMTAATSPDAPAPARMAGTRILAVSARKLAAAAPILRLSTAAAPEISAPDRYAACLRRSGACAAAFGWKRSILISLPGF